MKMAPQFVDGIRELIAGARTTVARGEDRAAYGEEVIRALADHLPGLFGKGLSASNLAYMRTFCLLYQARRPIGQTTSGELGPSQLARQ